MALCCFARFPAAVAGVVLVFLAAAIVSPHPSAAQPPAPAAQPPRLDRLEAALPLVRRGAGQPPLLVVDAANTRPAHERAVEVAVMTGSGMSSSGGLRSSLGRPPVLASGRDGALALRDVADFFDRRIASAGSVSVLAPTTMIVLNTRPGKPDLFAGLSRTDKLRMLFAGLTPAQWRRLGGEGGLGAGDLSTPAQRSLFLSLLPDTVRVQRRVMTADARGNRYGRPDGEPVLLTPGQRAGVRLALARRATLYVPLPSGPSDQPNTWRFRSVETGSEPMPEGATYLELASENPLQSGRTHTDSFGVTLRDEVPARAKPGDLAFESARLNALVALADAQTVGDLVRRAGEACRLEVYADARVAGLPVMVVRGGTAQPSARAGDLLQALSLAVTGTFRKITAGEETAWVLTDDREGLAVRQVRLDRWARAAGEQVSAQLSELRRQIVAQKPDQYVVSSAGDANAPSRDLLDKWEAARKAGSARERGLGTRMNVADLPSAYQQRAHAAAAGPEERPGGGGELSYGGDDPGIGAGQVGVRVRTKLLLVLPGGNVIENATSGGPAGGFPDNVDSLWRDQNEAPPPPAGPAAAPPPAVETLDLTRLPTPASGTRAVIVRAADAGEAAALVREAGRRGLNHVWLAAPDVFSSGESLWKTLLAAAITAGKQNNVAVSAVLPLLRRARPAADASEKEAASAETPDADELDRNVLGETRRQEARREAALLTTSPDARDEGGRRIQRENLRRTDDLVRVDHPETAVFLLRRLSELAATPGLAGIALFDTAAPGYAAPAVAGNAPFGPDGTFGFGFTPGLRLRLLRQASLDPIDLSGENMQALNLPFFPSQQRNFQHIGANEEARVTPDTQPSRAWTALRHETNRRFLADLHVAVRAAHPDLPLFIADRGETSFWFSRWERPDALPYFSWAYSGADLPPAPVQQARKVSSLNLLRIATEPTQGNRLPPWTMKDLATMLKDWNGIVFDLRDLPAEAALALLRSAFSLAAAPAATASDGQESTRRERRP